MAVAFQLPALLPRPGALRPYPRRQLSYRGQQPSNYSFPGLGRHVALGIATGSKVLNSSSAASSAEPSGGCIRGCCRLRRLRTDYDAGQRRLSTPDQHRHNLDVVGHRKIGDEGVGCHW